MIKNKRNMKLNRNFQRREDGGSLVQGVYIFSGIVHKVEQSFLPNWKQWHMLQYWP